MIWPYSYFDESDDSEVPRSLYSGKWTYIAITEGLDLFWNVEL
jgi:hypothetical protein